MCRLVISLKDGKEFSSRYTGIIGSIPVSGDIKIDTGCTSTAIMVRDLAPDEATLKLWKYQAILSNRRSGHPEMILTFGVHDKRRKVNLQRLDVEEIMAIRNVVFKYDIKDFEVSSFNFGTKEVWVSFDAEGESLLGMSILKDYDSCIYKNDEDVVVFQLSERVEKKRIEDQVSKIIKRR